MDPTGDHDLLTMLADVAASQRDLAGLLQYTPRAEQAAANCGHRLYVGVVHRAWGVAHLLAGDLAQAEARLVQALELFARLGARWQSARSHMALAEVALARKDAAGARQNHLAALVLFKALGAEPAVVRVRRLLDEGRGGP